MDRHVFIEHGRAGGRKSSQTLFVTVETSCSNQHAVEAFLGCSLEMLRSHVFVRGGMQLNLWLKLQTLTGIEAFTQKDFTTAFKARAATVKAYTEELQLPL